MADENNKNIHIDAKEIGNAAGQAIVSGVISGLKDADIPGKVADAGDKEVEKAMKTLETKLSQYKIELDPPIYINFDEKKVKKDSLRQLDKIAKQINKYAEDIFEFPEKSKTLASLQRTQGNLLSLSDNAIKLRTKGLTTKTIKSQLDKMDAGTKAEAEKIIGNIAQVLEFHDRSLQNFKDNKPTDVFDVRQVTTYTDSLKDVIRSLTVLVDLFNQLKDVGITTFSKRIKIDSFQPELDKFISFFDEYKNRIASNWMSMISGLSNNTKGITQKKIDTVINEHKLIQSAKTSSGSYIKVSDIRSENASKILISKANAIAEEYINKSLSEIEENLKKEYKKVEAGGSEVELSKLYNAFLVLGGKANEDYENYKEFTGKRNTIDYYVIEALKGKLKQEKSPVSSDTSAAQSGQKAADKISEVAQNAAGEISDKSEKTKKKVSSDANQAANNAQEASTKTKDKIVANQEEIQNKLDETKKKSEEVQETLSENNTTPPSNPPKPPKNPPAPNNPPSPPTTPPSNPPKPPKKGKLIREEYDTINGNWQDSYLDNVGQVHVVGERINKKTGDPEPFNKIIRSYKDLETQGISALSKLIEIHKKLRVAQMEDVPNTKYINALKEEQKIYQDRLKVTYSAAKLYDKNNSDYKFSDFVSALRRNSEGKIAESNSYIQKHSGQTNQLAAKVLSKNDIENLRQNFEQFRISMKNSGADTTLLENRLNALEKSLNNISDSKDFNAIKSNFNVLFEQFKTLDAYFKSDQKVYSDQISVIDELMTATTALNNTQANQIANPGQDLSETIKRQSEAVNELSVKAGEALIVIEDLFNAGGKISAEQVTDARNRLTTAASGSPESQENYNAAKIKSENKAYKDAITAIDKYKNAKSKLISLEAEQLANPEKDLSKSINEAAEAVKEYSNQAREAYLNVRDLAKTNDILSSDMVTSLEKGLQDASKGSAASQDKYNNARITNEKKQISDNLKILKKYYDTWTQYNKVITESILDKDNDPKKYAAETLSLKMKLDRMKESVLTAYDAIQKLNSATSEDKALADQYLSVKGTFASQRRLNDAKNKKATLEDTEAYKSNIKDIKEYYNTKAKLIDLNAKQLNAKNGEDYSSEIEKLTNMLLGLEQKANDAYDAIKKLQNITDEQRQTAENLYENGTDEYQKSQSNFGTAYDKNKFSEEKKALNDISAAYEDYIKKRIEFNNAVSKGVDDETFNILSAQVADAADIYKKTIEYAKTKGVLDENIRSVIDTVDTEYYSKAKQSVVDIGSNYSSQIDALENKLKNSSDNVKSIINDLRTKLSNVLTLNDQGDLDYDKINKFGQELKYNLDFIKELNNVENFGDKISKNIEGGLGSSVGKVKEYSDNLDTFKKRLNEILDSLNKTPPTDKNGLKAYIEELNNLNNEVLDFLKNKSGFKELTSKGLLDVDSIGNVNNLDDLSAQLEKYVAAKKYAKLSAIDLNNETQTATVKIKDENDAVRTLTASIDENAKAMRVKTGKASSFGIIKDVVSETSKYVSMMLDVGDVINFVRRNFSEAVNTFGEYDDALTNISYTMNLTQQDLDNLGQSVLDMADDLSMAIDDAASIYQIYANMNTTPEEISETARPTAILSNLSGVDASTASDQVQGILQQFNMLEEEGQNVADVSMHIVDVLDNISSSVAIDYAKGIKIISDAVQAAGAEAYNAGLSFEQLAAISAKISERTRDDGSSIGNAIKTIIVRLSKVGKMPAYADEVSNEELSNASKSLSEIGIQVYDTAGEFRELDTIIGELSEKWDTLSDAQQSNISYNIAATRQTSKFKNMLEAWTDSMDLANDAANSQGNALKNQEKYEESFSGKLQEIATKWDEFWIGIINSKATDVILDFISSLIDSLNNLSDALNPAVVGIGLFITALSGATKLKGLFGGEGIIKNLGKVFARYGCESMAA